MEENKENIEEQKEKPKEDITLEEDSSGKVKDKKIIERNNNSLYFNYLKEIRDNITLNSSPRIKEKRIKMFLKDGKASKVSFKTEKITGILQCIIIDSDKPITLLIRFDEYKNIEIFKGMSLYGQKYIHLKKEPISPDNQKLNFGTEKWYLLEDALEVIASDNINTVVKIIIRYI